MPDWAMEDIRYLVNNRKLLEDESGNLNIDQGEIRCLITTSRVYQESNSK